MKAYWGSGGIAPRTLTSARDGGEWSASRPGRFTPRKRAPCTHWIGGWVGLRAVLDAVGKRKIPSPRRESNPRTPIVKPVVQRYTDWAVTAQHKQNKHKNRIRHSASSSVVSLRFSSMWVAPTVSEQILGVPVLNFSFEVMGSRSVIHPSVVRWRANRTWIPNKRAQAGREADKIGGGRIPFRRPPYKRSLAHGFRNEMNAMNEWMNEWMQNIKWINECIRQATLHTTDQQIIVQSLRLSTEAQPREVKKKRYSNFIIQIRYETWRNVLHFAKVVLDVAQRK
jgi:hypothetical protein